jgi:hypothetical protein
MDLHVCLLTQRSIESENEEHERISVWLSHAAFGH